MSLSPLAYADSLRIGTIDYVSSKEIKVLLDIEAPDGVALNTGFPRPFPRINGYVLIPCDEGFLTAQVEWITIERSQYPKRKGMQDFGLVDLPYPLRKMGLNPLGLLTYDKKTETDEDIYRFRRGVESYPTVGDPVLLPTQRQLKAIIESGDNRYVLIGTSPMAANAEVKVDPNRLFGRHLAVLGNTGSGKSCSVAGLIRWCIEEARRVRNNKEPNARFIILDPNGEYSRVFQDLGNVRCFAIEPSENVEQLKVPMWFWNSTEWCAFAQASGKTQRPLLQRALRDLKTGKKFSSDSQEEKSLILRRFLSTRLIAIRRYLRMGEVQTDATKFGSFLAALSKDLQGKIECFQSNKLDDIIEAINSVLNQRVDSFKKNGKTITYYKPFLEAEIELIINTFEQSLDTFGGIAFQDGPSEDIPIDFNSALLPDYLEILAEQENASQYIDFLVSRLRTLLHNTRINSTISGDPSINLENWLCKYIGNSDIANGSITIIDLSLVPAEIVHIITAVLSRMILEALQRYRKRNKGDILPTVLVMEEAHSFIRRYKDDIENQSTAAICCRVFEKIAREGRKYGLGLVLSSQRPSELSPTVLSQCNSFLLHRISNDQDQELVKRLLPDNLHGMLHDLPLLPARQAILLGWASELPVLVQMSELPEMYRPKSGDPDFWAVWSGVDREGQPVERRINWKEIADDWQQLGIQSSTSG